MEQYSNWADVPEHLKTRTGLKKIGLKPKRGAKPVAVKTHWHWKVPDYDLYDLREAEPVRELSEKQRAALEKAREASVKARTCERCGWVEELGRHYRGKLYVSDGLCKYCREEVNLEAQIEDDREQATQWARRMLEGLAEGVIEAGEVLILDSETTDLHGEIIDLAIINLRGEVVYNQRFRPISEIAPGAQAVHGLNAEMLAGEPSFASEYPTIKRILEGAGMVLIYNSAYDVGALYHTCRLHECEVIEFENRCLMHWYAQWAGDWSKYHRDYRWQKLPGGDHSALGDCRAALGVVLEMAGRKDEDEHAVEPAEAAPVAKEGQAWAAGAFAGDGSEHADAI